MEDRYEIVIGLEVHAQLSTLSKAFASDSAAFGGEPNTHISVISLAHPGAMPKTNAKMVEYAIRVGLACNSEINRLNIFDRKNYFYPDLPKGYQISQDKSPICIGGKVDIRLSEFETKTIRLHHIHMEEDAGKSIHSNDPDHSWIDFNRAGVPLVEIVSEPDMRSAEEAALYMQEIRRLVRYLDICDGNMEEGSLRCDANVSVRPRGQERLGTRVEIKNMNSIRNLRKAIVYEAERQIKLIESGGQVMRETRTFDAQVGKTFALREKETLNDYRYFPEPDLTPIQISDETLQNIQAQMPALPWELFDKYVRDFGLSAYDAQLLSDEKQIAAYFEACVALYPQYKAVANWLNGDIKSYLNEHNLSISEFPVAPSGLCELLKLIDAGKISHTIASQKILPLMIEEAPRSAEEIAKTYNWIQESNQNTLESAIREVLAANLDKVKAYKNGKKGLQGMFMGEIMKKTQGKADPKLTQQLLQKALDEAEY
ncbi:MAG: Asp-tRNA(Asn)/Glu-tRNA(Gln) amidotransferase subunit GatB [Microscillaceae bacterium]|nr:Asp-tRNA(Asn)/Glu-tRNA(Gln) amidotransferase subunit GatB [Microscillaceae bacterium]